MIYQSPSNIALIKYMGKNFQNIPLNTSLSYTLSHLFSGVRLKPISNSTDQWSCLNGKEWVLIQLNQKEQKKFLDFFKQLKNIFNLKKNYEVQSANNFPKSAGIASSASSFSALTKAAYYEGLRYGTQKRTLFELASISRLGSGSSCRSFFEPWCIWDAKGVKSIHLPFQKLKHQVVWIDTKEKKVSSSLAHQRVRTSPHFVKRASRAEDHLKQLLQAFDQKDWQQCCLIVKKEFEDMHTLFETSVPSFSYRTRQTQAILYEIERHWNQHQDGPMVTMDAGANIHLLYRPDQKMLNISLKNF